MARHLPCYCKFLFHLKAAGITGHSEGTVSSVVQFSAKWKQFEHTMNSVTDNVTGTLQDRTCLSL